jgi:hypothetical protein
LSAKLPVDFKELAQGTKAQGAPPYVIRADDLMRNYAYAALQADESWIESTSVGAHEGRRLKLPAVPGGGTFVLGCVDGALAWIATEEC